MLHCIPALVSSAELDAQALTMMGTQLIPMRENWATAPHCTAFWILKEGRKKGSQSHVTAQASGSKLH
jgi:hypothetical protein